jgi:transposase
MKKIQQLNFNGQIFYIGIDVHSTNWKITVRSKGLTLETKSLDPKPIRLKEFMESRYPGGRYISVYEAGFSGYWAHRELELLGFKNIIVNPADVPTTNKEKDRKNDPIDSNKLSRELANNSLKGIYVPSVKMEAIRVLSRNLRQYSKRSTQVKNRIKAFLYFVGLSDQADVYKHWSNAYIQKISEITFPDLNHKTVMDVHIKELKHIRTIQLSLLRHMREESKKIPEISLLTTIPGIGQTTAFTIYAELFAINRFQTFDNLASYVGLVPSTTSSNDKTIIHGMTNRHSRYLRYMLIESAWVAVRKDPVLTKSFEDLYTRMSKTRAIVRIAKKLLNRIRAVWKNNEKYQIGIIETDRNQKSKEKRIETDSIDIRPKEGTVRQKMKAV